VNCLSEHTYCTIGSSRCWGATSSWEHPRRGAGECQQSEGPKHWKGK